MTPSAPSAGALTPADAGRVAAWRLPALSQPVRALLVDLDGTMVDTLGDFELALNRSLADLGLPAVDRAFISRTVGKGSSHLIARTLAHVGADPQSLQTEAMALYQSHYRQINGEAAVVYPGVATALARWAEAGVPMACLTNKPGAFAEALLVAKGLRPFFHCVFGGDAFARTKPDPLPIVETSRALGLQAREVAMVGDSRNDAEAARAAGCPVVLVRYGYNHGEPIELVEPDALVDRLDVPGLWPSALHC